jgi:transposase
MAQNTRKVKRQTRRAGKPGVEEPLREIRNDVAGIDIGALEIYIGGRPKADGSPNVHVIGTDTESLLSGAEWMTAQGIRAVAMESTGVYWIPFYQILSRQGFEVQLVDTRTVRSVPGRKSDVLDCQWLRTLLANGLLKGCFLPDDATAGLRSLQRMRQTLRHEQDDWVRRIQKQLDLMNVRVHRAVSDITGVTGMAILRAIVGGERDPKNLARLRDPRCRKSEEEIVRELTGDWREEHLQNLSVALSMHDHIAAQIKTMDQKTHEFLERLRAARVAACLPTAEAAPTHPSPEKAARMAKRGEEPIRQDLARAYGVDLTQIEGVSGETAANILMELGPDIPERFPTEKQFVSYLKLAPNLAISGGHPLRGKGKPKRGGPSVRRFLLSAGSSVRNSKTALGEYYRKTAFRKGAGVAVFATAGKIARRVYRALAKGVEYAIQGDEAWLKATQERACVRLARQAFALGMILVPAEPAPA